MARAIKKQNMVSREQCLICWISISLEVFKERLEKPVRSVTSC